jgi:hypothetical protein
VLRDALTVGVHDPEVVLRVDVSLLGTRPPCIDLLRLRLRTDRERDQAAARVMIRA